MDPQRWGGLTLREQIGHVTSEITRAKVWEDKGDLQSRNQALERALELLALTIAHYNKSRRRELTRFREVVCHCLIQSNLYQVSLSDLQRYGLQFMPGL